MISDDVAVYRRLRTGPLQWLTVIQVIITAPSSSFCFKLTGVYLNETAMQS